LRVLPRRKDPTSPPPPLASYTGNRKVIGSKESLQRIKKKTKNKKNKKKNN
jgi:hypothetical protein